MKPTTVFCLRKYAEFYKNIKSISFKRNFSSVSSNEFEINFPNGQKLCIETGSLARMADGSALVSVGDTSVLATAVSKTRKSSVSFTPLTVEYKMKHAASVQSNLTRLKYASMEKEILTARVIDRSIRPLFPPGFSFDTQITCQLMAVDGLNDPDVVCINAASTALAISDIPWNGPVGAVRVGMMGNKAIIFPTRRQLQLSEIDLIIVSVKNNLVVMIEGSSKNISFDNLMKAIEAGVEACQKIVDNIADLVNKTNKRKREFEDPLPIPIDVEEQTRSLGEEKLQSIFTNYDYDKIGRDDAVREVSQEIQSKLVEKFPDVEVSVINKCFGSLSKDVFRNLILDEDKRCDGRSLTDLRNISCKVNILKPLHGSSLFQRGQTQVQSTVTFDAPMNQRRVDPLLEAAGGVRNSNFILSYNFPQFATNELSRGGGISRREIGHGALAEKGLKPLIPISNEFSVSLSASVLESNGSSSMATVCGGSLALMDAGVNITSPAAGIAIGLITRYDNEGKLQKYKILTDLLGIEDYLGDMDFKIAGTKKGITAIQLDIKVSGIPINIVEESVERAIDGIKRILVIMSETIKAPRKEGEKRGVMPVIQSIECPIHQRSRLFGVNGVRKLEMETGVQITWLEENKLSIFAPNQQMMEEAQEFLNNLLSSEPELVFGAIYEAEITEIVERGIFVALYEGMIPVLVHKSQLDSRIVQDAHVLGFEVGQKVKLKYFGRDPASGKMRLSRRVLQISKDVVRDFTKK